MNPFEVAGSIFGIIGTVILSTKLGHERKWRYYVFILYLISNFCIIVFAVAISAYALLVMNGVYVLTSINGMRNNMSKKQIVNEKDNS